MRRIAMELILANHEQACPTCPKSTSCRLQDLARRLGVDRVRFKPTHQAQPVDRSSLSLVRDPNKCILCGDCVRACDELQGIGAIDFAYRGAAACVVPAFGKNLSDVECVNCGLCASVCPTGALTPRSEVEEVWRCLEDPTKTVLQRAGRASRLGSFAWAGSIETSASAALIAGIRPGVRHQLCGRPDGAGRGQRFIQRRRPANACRSLPVLPAWVKFAEQFCPDMLDHLSSCRSPQQMFGSLGKRFCLSS